MKFDYVIDCIGLICPMPLLEARKALLAAAPGDKILIKGDHIPSKKEIPMAAEATGAKVIEVTEENGVWSIIIEK